MQGSPTASEVMGVNVPPVVCTVAVVPPLVPRTLKVPPVVTVVPGSELVLDLSTCALTAVGSPPITLTTWPLNCPLGFVEVGIWTIGLPALAPTPISIIAGGGDWPCAEIATTATKAARATSRRMTEKIQGQASLDNIVVGRGRIEYEVENIGTKTINKSGSNLETDFKKLTEG